MSNFEMIGNGRYLHNQKEMTNQEKHHLAMWLTTILEAPSISKIVKSINERNNTKKQLSYVNIRSFNHYLIDRKNVTQEVRMFILSNVLDADLLKQNFYDDTANLSKQEVKAQWKLFKELRQQLQIQFHRQKLIFMRKLINIMPFQLFRTLDRKKTGYLTFKQVLKFIQQHISDTSIFQRKSLQELKQTFYVKLSKNIHDSSNLSKKVIVEKGGKDQITVNLENFTQLIERINCHPQLQQQIGTYKFLRTYIQNLEECQQKKLMMEDYQQLKQLAKSRQESVYHAELRQINQLAKSIVRTNQEFQGPQIQKTEQKVQIQTPNKKENKQVKTPMQKKRSKNKQSGQRGVNQIKFSSKLKSNKTVSHIRNSASKSNQRFQKSPYARKLQTPVRKSYINFQVKKAQKQSFSANKQPVSTALHANQQSERKGKQENYPISNNINTNVDQYRTPTNQKENYENKFIKPKPFVAQSQDKSILLRSQAENKNIEQILEKSRKQRERNINLNQQLQKRRNQHNFSMSQQFRFSLENQQSAKNQKQDVVFSKMSTIKKQNTNQKQFFQSNQPKNQNSFNNRPTHRIQPTFGYGQAVYEESQTFQDKLNNLHYQRKEALLKQLQQIKMERIRNRMHMYMFC